MFQSFLQKKTNLSQSLNILIGYILKTSLLGVSKKIQFITLSLNKIILILLLFRNK